MAWACSTSGEAWLDEAKARLKKGETVSAKEALQKAIESDEFKSFVAVSLVAPAFLNANDYRQVVDAERAIYARVVPKLALENR